MSNDRIDAFKNIAKTLLDGDISLTTGFLPHLSSLYLWDGVSNILIGSVYHVTPKGNGVYEISLIGDDLSKSTIDWISYVSKRFTIARPNGSIVQIDPACISLKGALASNERNTGAVWQFELALTVMKGATINSVDSI